MNEQQTDVLRSIPVEELVIELLRRRVAHYSSCSAGARYIVWRDDLRAEYADMLAEASLVE